MKNQEFALWAKQLGLTDDIIEQIIDEAASPEDMQEASEEMMPSPLVHTLDDIHEMHEKDPWDLVKSNSGFLVLGFCPNGDFFVMDIANDPGSVWYIGHESIWDIISSEQDVRAENAIRMSDSLRLFITTWLSTKDWPLDFYNAQERFGSKTA